MWKCAHRALQAMGRAPAQLRARPGVFPPHPPQRGLVVRAMVPLVKKSVLRENSAEDFHT